MRKYLVMSALLLSACAPAVSPQPNPPANVAPPTQVITPTVPLPDSARTYQEVIRPEVIRRLRIKDLGSSWLISLRDPEQPQTLRIVLSNGRFGFLGEQGDLFTSLKPAVNVVKGDWTLQLMIDGKFVTVLLEELP